MAVVVQPRQINFLMKIRARNVSPFTIYWIFRESLTMLARSSYAPVIPRCYRRHKESDFEGDKRFTFETIKKYETLIN